MTAPTLDAVIEKYMAIRRKKERVVQAHKEEVAVLDGAMEKLEAFLLQKMDADGVTSYKTQHGTAFRHTVDFTNVANWEDLLDYIKKNDAYELLNKSVNKTAVRNYLNENLPIPPGVTYGQRVEIAVRKPS